MKITLYGSEKCHKTQFYLAYFADKLIDVEFKDVLKFETFGQELRALYVNGKLNFPTLLINGKKLRNPRVQEIEKWLSKSEKEEQ